MKKAFMLCLGPKKSLFVTEAQTHSPRHGTVYQGSELSVRLLS